MTGEDNNVITMPYASFSNVTDYVDNQMQSLAGYRLATGQNTNFVSNDPSEEQQLISNAKRFLMKERIPNWQSLTSEGSDVEISVNGDTVHVKMGDGEEYDVTKEMGAESKATWQDINVQDTISSATKLTGLGFLTVDMLKTIDQWGPDAIAEMSGTILQGCLDTLSERCGMLVGKYMSKLTELGLKIPTEIVRYTTLRFNWNKEDAEAENQPDALLKKTIGEILAELLADGDERVEQKEKESKETSLKKFVNSIKEHGPEYINTVNKYVKESEQIFSRILTYATSSGEQLEQMLSNEIDNQVEKIDKELAENYAKVEEYATNLEKTIGYWQGKELVITYNAGITFAAKQMKHIQTKTSAKLRAKAQQAIQVAKLQLMSLIDVEL